MWSSFCTPGCWYLEKHCVTKWFSPLHISQWVNVSILQLCKCVVVFHLINQGALGSKYWFSIVYDFKPQRYTCWRSTTCISVNILYQKCFYRHFLTCHEARLSGCNEVLSIHWPSCRWRDCCTQYTEFIMLI